MRKIYFLLVISFLFVSASKAQVANYSFSASSGTYTPLTSPTNIYTGTWDDNTAVSVNLGFTFRFNDVDYTSVFVHPNGYLTFGSSTSGYTPISGTSAAAGVVAAWARDLQSQATAPTGSVDYESSGGIFTVQWTNARRYNSTTVNAERIEMQIRLHQGTNQIEFVYGTWSDAISAFSANIGEVGLRGSSNADFNNLSVLSGGSWAAPTPGVANNATVFYNQSNVTTKPASGQTYTYNPPPPCVAPAAQPTSLILIPGAGGIGGSFTAAAGSPTGYLVVQTNTATPPSNPVDGTVYPVGSSALGGTIISNSNATVFASTGLPQSTTFYYWIFSYNSSACSGGPGYLTTAPLSGNTTTTACSLTGTRTVGPTGNYLTLTAALIDVAMNGLAGNLILELQPTYTSAGEFYPIPIGPIACANPNTLTIRPQVGATGLVITSSDPVATIDIQGATNLIIDGRAGGVGPSQLSIINTATGGASTIRLSNDASNNTITGCTILGSGTTTASGVVLLGAGIVTGNDDNVISNNLISAAGANLPTNGILSIGTNSTIDNSGGQVTSNNIADVFNASAVFNGISLGSGNSDWSITGNRVYQTATRTATTGNTANGITITSGSGYTISNNVIGFASPAETGTMTMAATVALRYIGINGTFTAAGANSTINNNTVANISLSTSSGATTTNGILCGINLTSGNASITNNLVGATTGTGSFQATSSTSLGVVVGIHSSSVNTVAINDNQLGAFTSTGTTATVSGSVVGVSISGAAASMTIDGNTIGNATANNMLAAASGTSTGSTVAIGINSTAVPAIANYTNNTIRNFASMGTGSGNARGIFTSTTSSTTAAFNISGNTITNIVTNSSLSGATSGLTAAAGIHYFPGINGVVSNNVISNISCLNTGTVGTMSVGIALAQATTPTVSNNRIFNITNASTATSVTLPGVAAGILVRSGTTAMTIVNNMISLGTGQTTNTAFIGINGNHGSTPNPAVNIWFNSVFIDGTAASGAQPSFGIARTDFSATARTAPFDVRNNVVVNTRTGGTGSHLAIANNYGATASATGWGAGASDFNVLNAAAGTVGWWTTAKTFGDWQTASSGDANSISGQAVSFADVTQADLHINATPTPVEGNGVLIPAITTDFDGQTRNILTPTDIGADAGNFINYPAISFTPLDNSCASGARSLTATITDGDGVPTAGPGLPVLYWKINAGAYTAATATYLGTDQYQFTFGTGSVIGDVVSYYIVAQDNLGNVGSVTSMGASGFSINPPAAATPPTNPLSYTVLSTLSGTYTVGVGGNFTTLTDAVAAYNSNCLGGAVIFSLIDASYPSETFPITIDANSQASSVNTLTIRPAAGVTATISGLVNSGALIRNFSSYVTIDGSNNATTTRDLTITNTATTGPTVYQMGSTGTTPFTNNTLKNTIIINGSNTASAIVLSDAALGTAGYFNNITIQNNSIQRAYIAIYNITVPAPGNGSGLNISNNEFNTAGANSIRLTSIYLQGIDGATVSSNTIGNVSNTTDASNVTGVWLATGTVNTSVINNTINSMSATSSAPRGIVVSSGVANADIEVLDNTISGLTSSSSGTTTGIYVFGATSGVTVSGNKISDIKNTSTIGFGANGIQLGSTLTAANINVHNNFVSDVAADGFNGIDVADNGYGIIVTAGGGYDIHFNTVLMNTDQTELGGQPAALNVLAAVTTAGGVNVTNNILVNTQTVGTQRYAIISGAASSVFGTIDHNVYSSDGPNLGFIGSNRADIAALQAGFGGNSASIDFQPTFVSAADLHLSSAPGANWCIDGAGNTVAGITTDIDGDTRQVGTAPSGPDPGADEFTSTGFVVNNPAAVCDGVSVDLTAAPVTAGSLAGLTFEYYTDAAATNTLANPNAVTVGGTYYIKAINGSCSLILPVVVTINPKPTISGTVVQPVTCLSTDGSITLTLGGAVGPYTFAWVGSGVNPTAQDQSNLMAGSYSVTVTAANGCTEVAVFNLSGPGGCNSCPQVPTVTTTPSATSCVGTNNTITATGLVDMGSTYGITFKYSTSALADPYSGGTLIATVPNGSLTSGATVATTSHNFAATGSYIIYAILSPVPADAGCRPFAQVNLTVNSAPTVTCPANVVVSNDANQCGAIVNYSPATGTGVPAPTITYDLPSGSFFPVGTTTVTATATNGCGTATCTFTVTVNDTQTPVITCPSGITASNATGLCSATVNTPNPTVADNCPGFVVTWALTGATTGTSPATGVNFVGSRSFNVGVTTVTYTIVDASGNSSSCSFTVTVNDTEAPTVTCPANITVSNGAGVCSASVNTPNPTSNDNCGITVKTWALTGATTGASSATGLNNVGTQTFNVGVTTVTYTVTDAAGNTGSCTFSVTVNDTQLPVINCPANITVNTPAGSCTAVVNYTVTATDNCPGVTTALQSGLASGASFPVGVTNVTYQATDAAGNTSTCTFTVTVNDGQLPLITSQPVAQTSCVGSSATFTVIANNAASYQWQIFTAGAWNNITGATSSIYTVNNLTTAMNTNTYRVIVNGVCSSVTSNMATLFVNTLPQISLHPSMAPTLEPGDVMSITATGIPPGGSYVWLLDGNVIAGASGNVLNNVTVNGLGSYTVRYTDPRGCVSTSAPLVVTGTASSNVWVYPNPNNGQFQVRVFATGSTSPLTIRVYDSKGSLVYEKEHQTVLPFTQMDVNLGVKSSGIYTVRVHDGSGNIIGAKSVLVRY